MNIENMIRENPEALVTTVNGVQVADSLQVAENFGKRHNNVVRSIESLISELNEKEVAVSDEDWMYGVVSGERPAITDKGNQSNFGAINSDVLNFEQINSNALKIEDIKNSQPVLGLAGKYFIPDSYTDNRNRIQRKYFLTRDGFSLLVMGFTGPAALHWKLLYIEAFNKMEKALKESSDLQLLVSQITKDVLRNVLPQITQASQKTATEITEEQAPRRRQRIYTLYGNEEALPNFLTVYDIRDFLGIGQRQAYELVNSEGFPKKKIGANYRILKQDFLSWLHTN